MSNDTTQFKQLNLIDRTRRPYRTVRKCADLATAARLAGDHDQAHRWSQMAFRLSAKWSGK